MAAFDLKQVGQLFNTIVSAIRDDTPDMDALESQAIEWLKSARYKLMRDVEQAYYELERTRSTPMSQPAWALDPTQHLFLYTHPPPVLEPFCAAIAKNLETLLKDCGFKVVPYTVPPCLISFNIYFPAQLAAPPRAPRTLRVEDEFSRSAGGGDGGGSTGAGAGSFAASSFARLLIEARSESAGGNEEKDGQGIKEEEDDAQRVKKEGNEQPLDSTNPNAKWVRNAMWPAVVFRSAASARLGPSAHATWASPVHHDLSSLLSTRIPRRTRFASAQPSTRTAARATTLLAQHRSLHRDRDRFGGALDPDSRLRAWPRRRRPRHEPTARNRNRLVDLRQPAHVCGVFCYGYQDRTNAADIAFGADSRAWEAEDMARTAAEPWSRPRRRVRDNTDRHAGGTVSRRQQEAVAVQMRER
ncbi:hypothetical protein DFH08DRAFT_985138 [Mycena albidolilacea]|uniref:Uncharacterized protein n=1 Tax=Mycena albidolilacea TaxID=1033008 RepID=A0AAD7AC29_9AGAR|nr:hypothetical protein DFH08DRAFT_985138 [Mycena albidolilacea]